MKVSIQNKEISYKKIGKGKDNILFVHGWSGNKESLSKLAKELSSDYTCYLIDLLGRGESALPEKTWGIEEYGSIAKDFVTTVIGKQTYYIGHSFGGALGVYIASTSEVISKLVLCSPSYRRSTETKLENEKSSSNYLKSFVKMFLKPIRPIYYKVFYPNSDNFKVPKLESNFRKVITQDLTKNLKDISIPTLIVWGTDDIETPLNDAYVLNEGISGSELIVKGSYGHELPVYYPEVIASDINLFLKAK